MCGRYYIDSDMADEIEKVVHDIDQRIRQEHFAGDIFPTNVAPIIEKSEHGLKLDVCKWGYPLSQGKNLVINARAESVMDKPSFRNGILYHRILIPASGFYEWNRLKEKNTFSRYDAPVLYMAGFCDWFENERRFVIMTTAANESMIKVHDEILQNQKIKQTEQKMWKRSIWKQHKEFQNLVFTCSDGSPVYYYNVNSAIKDYVAKINVIEIELAKEEKREPKIFELFTCHTLRHTYATRCYENGVDQQVVQKLLGHSILAMTTDLYTHVSEEKKKEEVAELKILA